MSYLYVIAASDNGPVKLGLSIHPEKRVKQLQTGSVETYHLYHKELVEVSCLKKAEKSLHRLLSHKRMRGEWFDLTVTDAIDEVKFIRMTEDLSPII